MCARRYTIQLLWLLVLVGLIGPSAVAQAEVPRQLVAQAPEDVRKEIDQEIAQGKYLFKEGSVQSLRQAIERFVRALKLSKKANFRDKQFLSLLVLGGAYSVLGEQQQALDYYNQALILRRAVGDHNGEATTLNNIGIIYSILGKQQQALDYYNQALKLSRAMNDHSGEATTLNNIGRAYSILGKQQKVLSYYNQALRLSRAVRDLSSETTTLNNIGRVYSNLGEQQQALNYYNRALRLSRAVRDLSSEATTLNNIGRVYSNLGEQQQALNYYNRALRLSRAVRDLSSEATTLNNIGRVYSDLGERLQALDYYNQGLPLFRAVGNRNGEAAALKNIGIVYSDLGEQLRALDYYNQALPLFHAVGNRGGEAGTLNNIGIIYSILGEQKRALDYYNQALKLLRPTVNRRSEAITLNNIGRAYLDLGQRQQALDYYNQALTLLRAIGDRSSEATTLKNIARVSSVLGKRLLTIIILKQSVNVYESLRQDIRTLPRRNQETYTEVISSTYRTLADLLLAEGRIGEAQQVLELLKIQETKSYTRSTQTSEQVALSQSEQAILKTYDTLIAFSQDLLKCKRNPTCRTSNKLLQLTNLKDQQNQAFEQLVKTLRTKLAQRAKNDSAWIDPSNPNNNLRRRAAELLSAQPGSLLIYPLVLENKMWLLVASEGPVLTRYEVKVTQKELADTIIDFRKEMKRCETLTCTQADTTRAKALSQKLYNWMFPSKLQQAIKTAPIPITNLIFAPDRATRYIPMGALHDGKKYLAQDYTISTIVAASKTEASARLPDRPKVIGLGLSNSLPGFNALPSVPKEIDAIVKTSEPDPGIFSGTRFLNETFTQSVLKTRLSSYNILHMATHGKFVPGAIDKSFLVLGDGKYLPVTEIDNLDDLANIHLVVLSACETALGAKREEDGLEIAGISNAFLQRGAKAVIASLWQVNDPATGLYMQRFYENLAKPNMTKVKAMQDIRRDFITGKVTIQQLNTFRAGARPLVQDSSSKIDLSHPYYWAPFILIGNGL
ncbi:tetratricopeptide repeat protein [filamentous cyanobacterium LEGE 11480]|uniref:Tetratricopeptide repeat protein n=2 Tax=Romeriopsis TaxID=2992131 RepID=A0A928VVS8_9CYAN|nr:tetratricopeptide repeat protein [Romeriopsis navalis LEGE 11480]